MAKSGIKRKPKATEAFKREVVEAYRNRGTRPVSEITKAFAVANSQLHKWNSQFPVSKKTPRAHAVVAREPSPPAMTNGKPNGKQRAVPNYSEISRLQRENQTLTEEIEILKRTIVVFARQG